MVNIYESAGKMISTREGDGLLVSTIGIKPGMALTRRLLVRNDDSSKYYTNIQVTVVDSSGNDIHLKSGWTWKLLASDVEPSNSQWITATHSISLSSIGSADTNTYLPFWLRVEVPQYQQARLIRTLGLQVTATENLVG